MVYVEFPVAVDFKKATLLDAPIDSNGIFSNLTSSQVAQRAFKS